MESPRIFGVKTSISVGERGTIFAGALQVNIKQLIVSQRPVVYHEQCYYYHKQIHVRLFVSR